MNSNHPPTLHAIAAAVESEFRLPPHAIFQRCNQQHVCHPRQIACWLMYELTPASYPEIGQLFHRDHTGVMHSVRKIERELAGDADLLAIVERIAAGLIKSRKKES